MLPSSSSRLLIIFLVSSSFFFLSCPLSLPLSLLTLSYPAAIVEASAATAGSIRGVRPRDFSRYASSDSQFRCFDGSASVSSARVNDDYCDCLDGSDEPGSSACENGKFYCANKGSKSMTIPSSRVDDGICDCCDGTDETANCQDSCESEGKLLWSQKLQTLEQQIAGRRTKVEWIAESRAQREAKEADLAKFKLKLADRQAALESARDSKTREETLEAEENRRRENERKAKEPVSEEVEREFAALTREMPAEEAQTRRFEFLDQARENVNQRREELLAMEAAHEEARAMESTSGESDADVESANGAEVENFPYPAEYAAPHAAPEEENFPYPEEYQYNANADTKESNQAEVAAEQTNSVPQQTNEAATEAEEPPTAYVSDIDESDCDDGGILYGIRAAAGKIRSTQNRAQLARDEYEKWNKKVSKMQSKIDEIEKFLKLEVGSEGEFAKFHGSCFNIQLKQYNYEICPYEEAKQKEGASATSLGRWVGFDSNSDGNRLMKFAGGQSCWNGPQRSISVIMLCDSENRIRSVDEPSKCYYEMQFGTPAVCDENHIQALKLELQAEMAGEED